MNKKLNLEIGKVFGKWKIISNEPIRKNNLTHWKCECECGYIDYIPLNNLMNGSSTQCKTCGSKKSGIKRRKGYKLISGDMWSQIKSNAKRKKIPFNLRIEEAWDRYVFQNGRCFSEEKIYLSGYPYDKEKTTASLCLIKPELGYQKDNIIWLHKDVAKMKGDLEFSRFLILIFNITLSKTEDEIEAWDYDEEWWKK